jgi:hypothetical protein
MTFLYEDFDVTAKRVWRENGIHEDNTEGAILAAQNAASTFYGEVLAGTVLSLDGNNHLRPSAIAQFDGAQGPVNALLMQDARTLAVGDVVDVLDAAGATIVSGRTIDDITGSTITISGLAVSVADGDYMLVPTEWIPVGILHDQEEGRRVLNGSIIPREHFVTYGLEGNAKESRLIGLTDLTKQALAGGVLTDIPTGFVASGVLQLKIAGFLFW